MCVLYARQLDTGSIQSKVFTTYGKQIAIASLLRYFGWIIKFSDAAAKFCIFIYTDIKVYGM